MENIEVKGYVVEDIGDQDPALSGFRIEGNFCFENDEHKYIFEDQLTATFKLMMSEPHVQTLREYEEKCENITDE